MLNLVYIDDVVDATIAGMEVPEANGHVFNVGTGIATDVLTVAQTLCKHYGIEGPLTVSGNYRLGDIRHNYADVSLAKQILGFQPKWTFDAGIKQYTDAGVASTLMALSPIFIIAPYRWIYKQPVSVSSVVGTVISVIGASLFFLL